MKPDRFVKMVEQNFPHFYPKAKHDIAKLLRRQHAAMVRMVKKSTCDVYGRIDGNALLRAIARYKKGTP